MSLESAAAIKEVAPPLRHGKINFTDYVLVKVDGPPATRLHGFKPERGYFPRPTFLSSLLRWKQKRGGRRRIHDIGSAFAHTLMILSLIHI